MNQVDRVILAKMFELIMRAFYLLMDKTGKAHTYREWFDREYVEFKDMVRSWGEDE